MFRLREKLKYMALGALIALAGFVLGNMNENIEAQSGSEMIDELTVRKLTVLEDITVIADDGEPRVIISADENGGRVSCYGLGGIRAPAGAGLQIGKLGGIVGVTGRQGNAGASLTIGTEGGGVTIFSAAGKGGAALSIVEGDGVVFTRDRFGNVTGLD